MAGTDQAQPQDAAAGAEPQADEFSSAFAEFAAAKEVKDAGSQPVPPLDGGAQAEPPVQEDTSQPAPVQASQDPTPAAAAPAAAAAQPQPAPSVDIWSNVSPEQRAALDSMQRQLQTLEHADRSHRGRLTAAQRQIEELRRTPSTPQPAAAPAASGARQPAAAPSAAAAKGQTFLEGERWKAFREEFGDVAGPVEGLFAEMKAELDSLRGSLRPVVTDRREAAVKAETEALSHAHPDWRDLAGVGPGREAHPQFAAWVETQPASIKQILARNGDAIVNAQEAGMVMAAFKTHLGIPTVPAGSSAPQPAPQPQTRQPAPASQTPAQARRQAAKGSAVASPARDTGKTPGVADEFGSAFAHYAAKKEQQLGLRK